MSVPSAHGTERATSPQDLHAWLLYEKQTSPRPGSIKAGTPVGLLGLIDEDGAEPPGRAKAAPAERSEGVPIAPPLSSRRRFQAVQVADLAAWNVTGDPASLPVGLVGVLPDDQIARVFEAHEDDLEGLRRRNVELATLLHEQQAQLEAGLSERVVEERLAQEEQQYKRLERTNSLLLNQKISVACRLFAAESEDKLRLAQDQVRQLQIELRRAADALEKAREEIEALRRVRAQCPACNAKELLHDL